jgi:hypothetical protein
MYFTGYNSHFSPAQHFFDAVQRTPPRVLDATSRCLADFIDWWVDRDYGVWACSGDLSIFLGAIPVIIHQWILDPTLTDFEGNDEEEGHVDRRLTRVFEGEEGGHKIVHPHFFAECKFRFFHERYDRERGRSFDLHAKSF